MFELRRHFVTIVILLPLVVIARYALFENAQEFKLFAEELKRYVAPLVIALSVVVIVGLFGVLAKKIDQRRQERLSSIFFWFSSILLALAIAAVFAHVKLQSNQYSDETSRSVMTL
jgi:cytochrome bd-type quinol oxidase subunit 2